MAVRCSWLLLLGLPFLLSAIRDTDSGDSGDPSDSESSDDEARQRFEDKWSTKIGPYTCCCQGKKKQKCQYKAGVVGEDSEDEEDIFGRGGDSPVCCKLRKGGCPTFSKYDKFPVQKFCWAGNPQDLPALDDYQAISPETAQAYKGDEPMTPLAASAKGGQAINHYLARHRETEELAMLTMAPDKGIAGKLKKTCAAAKQVESSISSGGQAAMENSRHVARCHGFDPALSLLVTEYAGELPIRGLPAAVVPFAKPRVLLGLLKQVFLGLQTLSLAQPAQVHRQLRWESIAVDASRCVKLTGLSYAAAVGQSEGLKRLGSTPYLAPECRSKACAPTLALDAYSAGMMAFLTMCGAPEYFLLEGFHLDRRATVRAISRDMRAGVTEMGAMYEFGLDRAAEALKGLTMEQQMKVLTEGTIPEDFIHRHALQEKIQYCKAAIVEEAHLDPGGKLLIINKLLSRDPSARPGPAEVLQSSLFVDVPTGCDWSRPKDRFTVWGTGPRPTGMQSKILENSEFIDGSPQATANEFVKGLGANFWAKKKNPAVIEGYPKLLRGLVGWDSADVKCLAYAIMQQFKTVVPDGSKPTFFKFNVNYFHPDKFAKESPEVQKIANDAFSEVNSFTQDTYTYEGANTSPCDE